MVYTIKNEFLEISVTDAGGNMISVKYLGEERQWQGNEFWKSQDVVIFPIIGHAGEYTVGGKTYKPKSHGVARYSVFELCNINSDTLTLKLVSEALPDKPIPTISNYL